MLDRGIFLEPDAESPYSWDWLGRGVLDLLRNPFERIENQLLLLDAIAQLPSEAQRQVILLSFFYDWESAQIAEALDKTPQAVYNLKHRALRKLREILEQ